MRLIDADALMHAQFEFNSSMYEDTFDDGLLFVIEKIDTAPTVDAVPVVQGYWRVANACKTGGTTRQQRHPDKWIVYKCSNCGMTNGRRCRDNYCRNCGATMLVPDGSREDGGKDG